MNRKNIELKIPFAKYQGSGNDFILIDDRKEFFDYDAMSIHKACHRHYGVGADGLILLQPSKIADYRMRIFNADGREAAMCGNGARCLARFIDDIGEWRPNLKIETGAHILSCDLDENRIKVDMGPYKWIEKGMQIGPYWAYVLDTGVPHAVILQEAPINFLDQARVVRHHPYFQPHGLNVNFVTVSSNRVYIRTYERGVENETLSCGTGAVAVGVVLSHLYGRTHVIVTPPSQEDLHITILDSQVFLSGPAEFVFKGEIGKV